MNKAPIKKRLNPSIMPASSSLHLLTEERTARGFVDIPTSEVTNLALTVFAAGKEQLGELPERRKSTSHNSGEISIDRRGHSRVITLEHAESGDKATISIKDIDTLAGSNKAAKKLFVYILAKLNEQALSNGKQISNTISFPLEELVELGLYSSVRSARQGVTTAADTLTSLKIAATVSKGKKNKLEQAELAVIFPYCRIKKNVVTVDLNPRINWETIATFFTMLPIYSFKLGTKAFDLIFYIFYLARQNVQKIRETGHFNVSMRAIHSRLMLPSEVENHDPTRTIREPIEKAIEDIENAANTSDFTITPHFNEGGSVKEYLDNGYIEIGLKGEYAQTFIDLATRRSQQIEKAAKRKAAIEDKARAGALQKKIEAEELKPAQ